jgi:hypothetical protein
VSRGKTAAIEPQRRLWEQKAQSMPQLPLLALMMAHRETMLPKCFRRKAEAEAHSAGKSHVTRSRASSRDSVTGEKEGPIQQ